MSTPIEVKPGVLAVHVTPRGARIPVAPCASCERVMPIRRRGLCGTCACRHERDGTIADWGWTRADRLTEYAALRGALAVADAAARIGVSVRTAKRYEAALRGAAA